MAGAALRRWRLIELAPNRFHELPLVARWLGLNERLLAHLVGENTPDERLEAEFNAESVLELTPELIGPTQTRNAAIIGETDDHQAAAIDLLREEPTRAVVLGTLNLARTMAFRCLGLGARVLISKKEMDKAQECCLCNLPICKACRQCHE